MPKKKTILRSKNSKKTVLCTPEQVRSAAKYICKHNQYADTWSQDAVISSIYNTMIDNAGGNSPYVGTMGYLVVFTEDEDHIYCDVYVDPALKFSGEVSDYTRILNT